MNFTAPKASKMKGDMGAPQSKSPLSTGWPRFTNEKISRSGENLGNAGTESYPKGSHPSFGTETSERFGDLTMTGKVAGTTGHD